MKLRITKLVASGLLLQLVAFPLWARATNLPINGCVFFGALHIPAPCWYINSIWIIFAIAFGLDLIIHIVSNNGIIKRYHRVKIMEMPNGDKDDFFSFASLRIVNKESYSLDCYAVMTKNELFGKMPLHGTGTKRIPWKVIPDHEDSMISIGARDGEGILHVFTHSIFDFNTHGFCYCGEKASFIYNPNPALYKIEIKFFGRFSNDEELILSPFVGYVYTEYNKKSDNSGMSYVLMISKEIPNIEKPLLPKVEEVKNVEEKPKTTKTKPVKRRKKGLNNIVERLVTTK